MPLNSETTEEVNHNFEVVDITTVNLTAAEGDMKMWPEVGIHPIKTEEEETKHIKAHNQQLHHTDDVITEVEEVHLDKQENGVQPVES